MSSKINNLNPVPLYGYSQHAGLNCNSPMSAAYCRTRSQDQLQSKYNNIHYVSQNKNLEGFQNINVFSSSFNKLVEFINWLFQKKVIENNANMSLSNDCYSLIHSNNDQHQLPSFGKSKVSPIDSNTNNKMVNELYLRQCFDSQYDGDVGTSVLPTTLIQK